jgi:hypothetical protein
VENMIEDTELTKLVNYLGIMVFILIVLYHLIFAKSDGDVVPEGAADGKKEEGLKTDWGKGRGKARWELVARRTLRKEHFNSAWWIEIGEKREREGDLDEVLVLVLVLDWMGGEMCCGKKNERINSYVCRIERDCPQKEENRVVEETKSEIKSSETS